MRFTGFKHFKVLPIGEVVFIFNKRSRRKGQRVLVTEVTIHDDTTVSITEETEKELNKLMTEKGSDLLSDGQFFYTLFGKCIRRIEHPSFKSVLNMEDNFNEKYQNE